MNARLRVINDSQPIPGSNCSENDEFNRTIGIGIGIAIPVLIGDARGCRKTASMNASEDFDTQIEGISQKISQIFPGEPSESTNHNSHKT